MMDLAQQYGIKISDKTGMPIGRPPKDPVKRAAWQKIRDSAAAMVGTVYDGPGSLVDLPVAKEDPKLTDEEIIEMISQRFDILNKIAAGACEGSVRSLIVSGAGGVGKTHTIEQKVEHYVDEGDIQAEVVKGVLTPINLYMLLYRNRHKNSVTILDDADAIFWNEDALGILKAALDSSKKRKISWLSESSALKNNDVPQTFDYHGSIIFITNIDFQSVVDGGKGKLVPHLQALMTRAIYLDLKLHTPREVGLWIDYMVQKHGILIQDGLSEDQQEDVLNFIADNRTKLRNLSIRTALKLSFMVKTSSQNWRKMAETLEFK